tara:strand:+ start:6584 stop:7936 length:1353 start_codon:yes stop_codon:yes gene_type:complete
MKNLIKRLLFLKVLFIFFALVSLQLHANEEGQLSNPNMSFSKIDLNSITISESDYFDFIRESIITQPEFLYAQSNFIEKNQSLKFAKRQRWPELSVKIINDHIIDRKVSELSSLRKRQDDSFDASFELSQPIYTGGSINSRIRRALSDQNLSKIEKENALSNLILSANEIYLSAIKSDFLYNYGNNLINEIEPYLSKVQERVTLGIADPIQLALFLVKYNTLKAKVQRLKTEKNRDTGIFEYFFGKEFKNMYFPNVLIPFVEMNKSKEAYNVKASKLQHEGMQEDTKMAKSEFRPKFGINTRYTLYDIDQKENDADVRGGVYFSMPIFTFGRAGAKISAAAAKENAYKMSIDVERKKDDVQENEIVNLINSSLTIRSEILEAFEDTKNQRRIIKNRLDSTSFSPETYINSGLEEIGILTEVLNTEVTMVHSYFQFLHQNQKLNNYIRINP